jgi:hypothetical protein
MRRQRCGRPSWWRRVTARAFRRAPRLFDYGDWQEPPPDIGVREPRRPRPSAGGASAVIDPRSSPWLFCRAGVQEWRLGREIVVSMPSHQVVIERTETPLMFKRAADEVTAIRRGMQEVEDAVGLRGRKYYGVFDDG